MERQITRAEVVSSGIVLVFSDGREAFLTTEELFAHAKKTGAFERADQLRGDDAPSA